jgi:hypothetical protein
MEVEFLYCAECPSHGAALERLKKVLSAAGWRGAVRVTEISDLEQAIERGFSGSPTILLDGEDIDSEGRAGEPPGLGCRIYRMEDGRVSPLPSEWMIRAALDRKTGGKADC